MKKIILLFFLLITTNIVACTCFQGKIEKRHYDSAELIIKGKVLKITYDGQSNEKIITFQVYKNYKGDLNKIIKIRTHRDGATCGLPVNNQDKWLIFAYKKNNNYNVGLCGKNVRYNKRPSQDRKSRRIKRRKMKGYIKKINEFRELSIINS